MEKDYRKWFGLKSVINSLEVVPHFDEQEVWWVSVGCNVGYEQDGKNEDFSRPVLVLRKFNFRFFLGVPLSRTPKTGVYYYSFMDSPNYKKALLSQLRVFDAKRLINKDGWVHDNDLVRIKKRLSGIIWGL